MMPLTGLGCHSLYILSVYCPFSDGVVNNIYFVGNIDVKPTTFIVDITQDSFVIGP